MAYIAKAFVRAALVILGICFFSALLFLMLAIVFRKKKPVRIVCTVLTVLNFLPIAGAVWLFMPHSFMVETPDGEVRVPASKDIQFMEAMKNSDCKAIEKMLNKYPALVFYRDMKGRTVLEQAMLANDTEMMKCALDHGAIFDDPFFYDNYTHAQCSMQYYLEETDRNGKSIASYDTVKYMIDNGASVDYKDKSSSPNALFDIARSMCMDGSVSEAEVDVLKLLIDSGADVSEVSKDTDNTPYDALLKSAESNSVTKDSLYRQAEELLKP